MTKRSIMKWSIWAVAYLAALVVDGILLSAFDSTEKRVVYSTFKDLMGPLIALPAAWLGFCFQRRITYVQELRATWTKLVDAVQTVLQYTRLSAPTTNDYFSAATKMSAAIDGVRGLFTNLDETDTDDGLYPFEPLKDIYGLLATLGVGTAFTDGKAQETREKVLALWKDVRRELLKEFDRERPTFPHSHWDDVRKSEVYLEHGIPRTPT